MIYLYLSRRRLAFVAKGPPLQEGSKALTGGLTALDAALPEFLNQLPALEEKKIHLVLGADLAGFQSFAFPLVKPGRVGKLLQFELENQSLAEPSLQEVRWQAQALPAVNQTWAGVYQVQKAALAGWVAKIEEAGFALERVSPWLNLLDLSLQQETPPPGAVLCLEPQEALLLQYRQGVLAQVGRVPGEAGRGFDLLARAGRSIKALLWSEQHASVTLHPQAQLFYQISDSGEILLKDPSLKPEWKSLFQLDLLERIPLAKAVDFLASPGFQWDEVIKLVRQFKKTALWALALLGLYAASQTYQLVREAGRLEAITQERDRLARRYAPGTAPAQALAVIKQGVAAPAGAPQAGLAKGEYAVSELLLKLGRLQNPEAGLRLEKLRLSESGLSLSGELRNLAGFEELKNQAETLFPPAQFRLDLNQNSGAEGRVVFTLNIAQRG